MTALHPGVAEEEVLWIGGVQGFFMGGSGPVSGRHSSGRRNEKWRDIDDQREAGSKAGWERSKLFWKLLFIPFFIVGVGGLFIPLWESIEIEAIQCEVVSAEPRTSSGGLRGSASTAGVLVDTANCGDIVVSSGVTLKNQEEVAASFKAGDEYEFDIGWFSRVVMEGVFDQGLSAQDYRLVP